MLKRLSATASILFCLHLAAAQQPQTSTAPIYAVNAKYANGVAPGYWAQAGSGLTLNLSSGTSFCTSSMATYAAGALTMTASATNYVYLNTAASCVPAVKTAAFTASDIPIATVVTSGSAITSITDDRTPFNAPNSTSVNGGSIPPSQPCVGTNSSGQIVTGTCGGTNMPATIRGSNLASGSTTGSQTVSLPAGTIAGDFAVLFYSSKSGGGDQPTTPSGWTVVIPPAFTVEVSAAYSKTLTSADIAAGSVTIAITGTGNTGCQPIVSIVTFIGATGGVREAPYTNVAGASVTVSTSSSVVAGDAALYYCSSTGTTPSINRGTPIQTLNNSGLPNASDAIITDEQFSTGGVQSATFTCGGLQQAEIIVVETGFQPYGTGSGTVTSVGLALPGVIFDSSVPGSPVTGAGTLSPTLKTQLANMVFAGPSSGSAATPTFRSLVSADLPAMVGDSGSGGAKGAVPAPASGDAAAGKFLKSDGTWQIPPAASGMSNPMTAAGDIIIGGTGGTPTKLANDTDGKVLTMVSGAPAWSTVPGAMAQIGQVVVSGTTTSTVTFTSIPGTYSQLQLVINGMASEATTVQDLFCTVNSDTGSNYSYANLFGGQAAPTASTASSGGTTTNFYCGSLGAASGGARVPGASVIVFPSYANTVFGKRIMAKIDRPYDSTGTHQIDLEQSMLWNPTTPAAITSITITDTGGGHLIAGSTFTLYGIQ